MSPRLIVVTGPESSGKTVLAAALAKRLACPVVPEAARERLSPQTPYAPSTLLDLAQAQHRGEREALGASPSLVVADTDLQVLRIWWQEKFGPCPRGRFEVTDSRERFYLLCAPDLPWEPDPLRENPHDRDRLMALYRHDIERRDLAHSVVEGTGAQRLANALEALPAGLSRRDASMPA